MTSAADRRLEDLRQVGWRATPAQLVRLLAGLWIFGTGEALLVDAVLGNSPWTVLAQGLGEQLGWNIGLVTVVVSFGVLLLWIPLRERPGLGTILNAIVVGTSIGVMGSVLDEPGSLVVRYALMLAGIGLVGLGSGLYINAQLGRGPRDGLMTGIHLRTGLPIAAVRTGIEIAAVAVGLALGGTAGLGTVLFAVLIGPAVAMALRVLPARREAVGVVSAAAEERAQA